nr:variable surface lipoprotein [Mycoplasmopsis bovis]
MASIPFVAAKCGETKEEKKPEPDKNPGGDKNPGKNQNTWAKIKTPERKSKHLRAKIQNSQRRK